MTNEAVDRDRESDQIDVLSLTAQKLHAIALDGDSFEAVLANALSTCFERARDWAFAANVVVPAGFALRLCDELRARGFKADIHGDELDPTNGDAELYDVRIIWDRPSDPSAVAGKGARQ